MNTKIEIVKLENNCVVSTSSLLFNTFEKRSDNTWLFYNADLNEQSSHDTTKCVCSYIGTPMITGVDENLFASYKAIADSIQTPAQSTVYHYINGSWVKCTDYCPSGYDHKSNKGF